MDIKLTILLMALPWVSPLAQAAAGPPEPQGLESLVQAARADAARRTGQPDEVLELVGAERVTWRDGSLGCPQPGMSYTMALVPGYRIRLRWNGELFDYHASLRGALRLCPAGHAVDPLPDSRI